MPCLPYLHLVFGGSGEMRSIPRYSKHHIGPAVYDIRKLSH